DVTHRLVPDRLVDVVRGRGGEVRGQEKEPTTRVELRLADARDERARVASIACRGRRIDGPDAHAIRRPAADTRQRDDLAVLPQVERPAAAGDPAVCHRIDVGGLVLERLAHERVEPACDEGTVGWLGDPGVTP